MAYDIREVGVIGLGRMGSRMAARLADAGFQLHVRDVLPSAVAPLVERGAQPHGSAASIGTACDVILTSLSTPHDVDDVMVGPDGLIEAIRPGGIIIETSTVGPAQSQSLAERFAERGAHYLDAPVSGGTPGAEKGTLAVMVGGDEAAFRRVRPVLDTIGREIHYLGASGSGSVAKVINQMVFLSYAALLCETVALADRYGITARTLLDVLEPSLAGQPLSTGWHEKIKAGDTTPGFHVNRVIKDLTLGAEMCSEIGFDAPVFSAALAAYREARARGLGDCDLGILTNIAGGEPAEKESAARKDVR